MDVKSRGLTRRGREVRRSKGMWVGYRKSPWTGRSVDRAPTKGYNMGGNCKTQRIFMGKDIYTALIN